MHLPKTSFEGGSGGRPLTGGVAPSPLRNAQFSVHRSLKFQTLKNQDGGRHHFENNFKLHYLTNKRLNIGSRKSTLALIPPHADGSLQGKEGRINTRWHRCSKHHVITMACTRLASPPSSSSSSHPLITASWCSRGGRTGVGYTR